MNLASFNPKLVWSLTKEAVSQWSEDFVPSMGAALAYYTVFSIAPLLVIAIAVAGFFFGHEAASGEIFSQLRGLVGDEGATAVQGLVKSASNPGTGTFAAIVGVVTLLLGATTVFGELQSDLDRIWDAPKEKSSGLWGLLRGRLQSFGMILGIGFLLLVSLVVSAAVSALGHFWASSFAGWEVLLQVINFVVGFAIVTGLFAMIYKLLPRCEIGWKDVWVGAAVTSLLFSIGKLLIGLYLGKSSVASGFGAAGSLVVLLVWVYYSAQIFLLGAEFTKAYAYRHGSRLGWAKGTSSVSAMTPDAADPKSAKDEARREHDEALVPMNLGVQPPPSLAIPGWSTLRIAAGIAAAIGLLAGETLAELRRHPPAPRRSGRA